MTEGTKNYYLCHSASRIARRTRSQCQTMVSSFKLSSGTVCSLRFFCVYQCSSASDGSSQIFFFFFIYDQLCNKT